MSENERIEYQRILLEFLFKAIEFYTKEEYLNDLTKTGSGYKNVYKNKINEQLTIFDYLN